MLAIEEHGLYKRQWPWYRNSLHLGLYTVVCGHDLHAESVTGLMHINEHGIKDDTRQLKVTVLITGSGSLPYMLFESRVYQINPQYTGQIQYVVWHTVVCGHDLHAESVTGLMHINEHGIKDDTPTADSHSSCHICSLKAVCIKTILNTLEKFKMRSSSFIPRVTYLSF